MRDWLALPDLSLRELKAFGVVAELGSFAAAAQCLHVSQPAVSAMIRNLERQLGVQLFARGRGRRAVLTGAGRSLHEHFTSAYPSLVRMFEEVRAPTPKGPLRLVIASQRDVATYYLVPVLAQFLRKWSDLSVTLYSETQDAVLPRMENGEAMLGFVLTHRPFAEMDSDVIATDTWVLVVSADHPLARQQGLAPEDLQALPAILGLSNAFITRLQHEVLSELGIGPPTRVIEVQDTASVKELLRYPPAWSILPRFVVAQELRNGQLVALSMGSVNTWVQVQALYHPKLIDSHSHAAARELCIAIRSYANSSALNTPARAPNRTPSQRPATPT